MLSPDVMAALKEHVQPHDSVSFRAWIKLGDRIEEYERQIRSDNLETDDIRAAIYVAKGMLGALYKRGAKNYSESDVLLRRSPELTVPVLNGVRATRQGLFDALVSLPFIHEGWDNGERTLRLDWPTAGCEHS